MEQKKRALQSGRTPKSGAIEGIWNRAVEFGDGWYTYSITTLMYAASD